VRKNKKTKKEKSTTDSGRSAKIAMALPSASTRYGGRRAYLAGEAAGARTTT